jgi:DNA-binding NarL/FixJ family response regulator
MAMATESWLTYHQQRQHEQWRAATAAQILARDAAGPDHGLRRALARALRALASRLDDRPELAPRQRAAGEASGSGAAPGAGRAGEPFAPLTAREREGAAMVAQGLSNRQIAEALVVSRSTANVHVHNILGKLGFGSRTQVAVWAAERGLHRAAPG